jgi:hypothetical protein
MIELNLTPEQLLALGLPSEGVTAESFLAALDALILKAKSADDLTVQAGDAAGKLAGAQAEMDRTRAEMEELYKKLQDLEKAQRDAGVDAILEQYADRLPDEKMKTRLRALLQSDRESAMDILKGLPAPGATVVEKKDPPTPVHTPGADQTAAADREKADQLSALIKTIQKEGKFKDFNAAREEARRRQPDLFA